MGCVKEQKNVDVRPGSEMLRSPQNKGHQSGGGNYWIRMGVRDWSEIGALGPFGRMENANWVILRF